MELQEKLFVLSVRAISMGVFGFSERLEPRDRPKSAPEPTVKLRVRLAPSAEKGFIWS